MSIDSIPRVKSRPFSEFIQTAAERIKNKILKNLKFNLVKSENKSRFIVVHLRAFDRPCALSEYSGHEVIKKLEQYGVNRKQDFAYIMTSLIAKSDHLRALRNYFGQFHMSEKKDIYLFRKTYFESMGSYLVYAVELELQNIADAVVRTYPPHIQLMNSPNTIGILASAEFLPRQKKINIYQANVFDYPTKRHCLKLSVMFLLSTLIKTVFVIVYISLIV